MKAPPSSSAPSAGTSLSKQPWRCPVPAPKNSRRCSHPAVGTNPPKFFLTAYAVSFTIFYVRVYTLGIFGAVIICASAFRAAAILASLLAAIIVTSAPGCQAQAALVLGNANPQTYGLPNDLHVVLASELPSSATWYCLRHWQELPPSPFDWCAGRTDVSYYVSPSLGAAIVFVDDPALDAALEPSSSASAAGLGVGPLSDGGPPPPGGGGGGGGGGGAPPPVGPPPGYQTNHLWLQIFPDTNLTGYADLILHNATNYMYYYQLLSKTNLIAPWLGGWALGEVKQLPSGTNDIWFTPVICTNPPNSFFRAVGAPYIASVATSLKPDGSHAIEPSSPGGTDGRNADFYIQVNPALTSSLKVSYSTSGTAINGVDYTNCVGSVVIAPGGPTSVTNITVIPLNDGLIDFDRFAVFTLVQTNGCGYVVDTNISDGRDTISIIISDNFKTNILCKVAPNTNQTDLFLYNELGGIDYFAPSNCLVLSMGYGGTIYPDFALLRTNNNNSITWWSGITNVGGGPEVKIATVKSTTNGFTSGDLFFGNGYPGGIGWLSASGTTSNLNWATLNEPTTNNIPLYVAGDLYVDQTGIWGNDLLAVTGNSLDCLDGASYASRGVWRIGPLNTNTMQITRITGYHLEGLLTVPTNSCYGPWAGKLLTGDECQNLIYAIDTNGFVQPYSLPNGFGVGISPDTFRLIPTNQDLYCCADLSGNNLGGGSLILKLSRQLLTNYVGDVLISQSGELYSNAPPAEYIVRWNETKTNFDTWTILLIEPNTCYTSDGTTTNGTWFVEKAAFAPVSMPVLPP